MIYALFNNDRGTTIIEVTRISLVSEKLTFDTCSSNYHIKCKPEWALAIYTDICKQLTIGKTITFIIDDNNWVIKDHEGPLFDSTKHGSP
jgi:hypothetical protein